MPEGRSYVIKLDFTSENAEEGGQRSPTGPQALCRHAARGEGRQDRAGHRWLPSGWTSCAARSRPPRGAVERYRIKHDITDVNGVSLNEQRLFDLNQRLSALRADDAAAQAKVAQIRAMRASGFDGARSRARGPVLDHDHQPARAREPAPEGGIRAAQHLRRQAPAHRQRAAGEGDPAAQDPGRGRAHHQDDRERGRGHRSRASAHWRRRSRHVSGGTIARPRGRGRSCASSSATPTPRATSTSRSCSATRRPRSSSELIEADAKVVSTAAPPASPSTPGPKLFGAVGFTASLMLGTLLALLLERLRQRPAQRQAGRAVPGPAGARAWCRGSTG